LEILKRVNAKIAGEPMSKSPQIGQKEGEQEEGVRQGRTAEKGNKGEGLSSGKKTGKKEFKEDKPSHKKE
jgi:hypothetical protein